MYPNGYSTAGLKIDEDELASCIRDYKELNLEKDFRDFSDWESGMIQSQVDRIVCSMKNEIGCEVKITHIAADGAKALYDFATYAVAKFYAKNQASYSGNVIKGIVISPYLIMHPAYEIYEGYLPVMFWQGSNNGSSIVNGLVNVVCKHALEKYFPKIDFYQDLKFWINYANNFSSGVQALEVKNALLQNGILQSQIIENNYTKNEIWDPTDGMEAPVEKIAQDIVQRNIQQDIKRKYSLLMPLSIDDLKDVAAQCGKIRIDDFAMGGKSI